MSWLFTLQEEAPVAHGMLVLCAVTALGLVLGAAKFRGAGLGIAGVLFSGLLFGHLGWNIDPAVRNFLQEFGLILFVYTIGMQVGPGFFNTLRRQGLSLNLAAAAIVLVGAALTAAIARFAHLDIAAAAGVFAGATTNTPALGAAQEALKLLPAVDPARVTLPGLGSAVTYPFGIIGLILALVLLRALWRVDAGGELARYRAAQAAGQTSLERATFVVENPNLDGLRLRDVPGLAAGGVAVSRVRRAHEHEVAPALPDTVLHAGDVILAVGEPKRLAELRVVVGRPTDEDLLAAPGPVRQRRIVVTHREVVGKALSELGLDALAGVTVTRLTRADVELGVAPYRRLQFGDMLMVVGTEEALGHAREILGDSVQQLNHTSLIPVFVGIALGVLAGSCPIGVPGMPAPLRLGLAGGPMIVAILLSRLGRIGPLLWYMPVNANFLLREIGITLFLGCVGLGAGAQFVSTLREGDGLVWMAWGAVITLVPVLIVAAVMRWWLRLNFLPLCGLLSGAMTNPPALAFANSMMGADAASVAYATVYPATMLLRIVAGQVLVLLFAG